MLPAVPLPWGCATLAPRIIELCLLSCPPSLFQLLRAFLQLCQVRPYSFKKEITKAIWSIFFKPTRTPPAVG